MLLVVGTLIQKANSSRMVCLPVHNLDPSGEISIQLAPSV